MGEPMGIVVIGNETTRNGKSVGKGYSSHGEAVEAGAGASKKAAKGSKQVSVPAVHKSDQGRIDPTEQGG